MRNEVLFSWSERYVIDHPEIDQHHQTLLALLNRLYVNVQDCHSLEQERALTGEILQELLDYVVYHFHAEEALMKEIGYPATAFSDHVEAHASFIIRVQELVGEHKRGVAALSFPVFEFLQQWLVRHIGEVDRELAQYIRKRATN